ncbi:hypothetical protein HanRHA438_Chr16g0760451 [Helianthus annuus]|uniref:Putative S-adenosyl-L-methionine-dependent methyltransferase n=1 Tax=Helianthus annuus TaxID=4232 RepID=A0A251RYY2_HELAN|nr:hypothetical protein HanXRQr2_Chr16g0748631 [Helianthus annuus]KAJ0438150.1 hypothetical protein HanHA300_Chr16g0610641 [Helianthus annuus]KAJ0442815.1 hypothetical protein HanIR_Chr16g0813671 [Helianthus annuus]KAJ0460474.1 hypothetical protein HanHA89_Chr16g0661241 [Helianthus annuus]KAJ0640912.1 hypothetical protein HanLR1_Chr16g0621111 [Helianthus annuus]
MNLIMQGKRANEPDVAEFISAVAMGNNAQFMVVAYAATTGSITLGLIAASHQTGGRVVCIVKGIEELESSKQSHNSDANQVEFIVGNAQSLLSNEYKSADFVVIDCNLEKHEGILGAIQNNRGKSTIVLGCNAYWKDSWVWSRSNGYLLPIGEGLLMMKVAGKSEKGGRRRSHWVVKVAKCTGEEHIFRIKSPDGRVVKA